MVKAKTAIVIVILALLHLSWSTAGQTRVGGIQAVNGFQTRVSGIQAVMTVNRFQKGADGAEGTAACDGRSRSADDLIVALPPGWYAGGKRCRKTIYITSVDTGRTVEAQVVDECGRGCKNNIVHSSPAVWKKLGLRTDIGKVRVTWSDA